MKVEHLISKTSAKITILRDVLERAWQQRKIMSRILRDRYYSPPVLNPSVPINMDSVFCPGQPIVVMYNGRDIDELSTKADDGDTSVCSEEAPRNDFTSSLRQMKTTFKSWLIRKKPKSQSVSKITRRRSY